MLRVHQKWTWSAFSACQSSVIRSSFWSWNSFYAISGRIRTRNLRNYLWIPSGLDNWYQPIFCRQNLWYIAVKWKTMKDFWRFYSSCHFLIPCGCSARSSAMPRLYSTGPWCSCRKCRFRSGNCNWFELLTNQYQYVTIQTTSFTSFIACICLFS